MVKKEGNGECRDVEEVGKERLKQRTIFCLYFNILQPTSSTSVGHYGFCIFIVFLTEGKIGANQSHAILWIHSMDFANMTTIIHREACKHAKIHVTCYYLGKNLFDPMNQYANR